MRRRTFLKAAGAATVPLITGLPAGCGRPPTRSNVVVVLVDQLTKSAADQWLTGVRDLAGRGVRFEQMRTVAPWTYPSVMSLLSGLYPQQHGATGHLSLQQLSVFDERVPLLPAILRSEGYRTAAFITNPFLHTWHPFHRAFDDFDASFINNQGPDRLGETYVTERMYANSVNPAVKAHFASVPRGQPEFTYVHYMDVHGPWRDGVPFDPGYENAVRYLDERIVELYEFFLQRYDGDLLFCVTSDHGRSFPDDISKGYGAPFRRKKASMHDFNLRVPLFILPSAVVSEGRTVALPCSTIDLVPTLAEWLGVRLDYPTVGASLLPAIRGASMTERPSYALMHSFLSWTDCVVFHGKKYIRVMDHGTGEVQVQRIFDLEADPDETVSLGDDFGPMQEVLDRLSGTHGLQFTASFEEVDPEIKERLQSLGYLE